MNPLRSVGAQLSLALAVLVAGSLGVVYLFVVPSLEHNLVNAKLSQLERDPRQPEYILTVRGVGYRFRDT